jgi:hypothetical protein
MPVKQMDNARPGVVDSTEVKVYEEGEWKTHQHD